MTAQVTHRRVYEDPSSNDGKRVLVDRVWPRGLSKQRAQLDEWLRDIAPSTELRRWYGHEPSRFSQFREHYLVELDDDEHQEAADRLRELAAHNKVTLLTATKDTQISHAVILESWLTG